jgi:hypothetical protein
MTIRSAAAGDFRPEQTACYHATATFFTNSRLRAGRLRALKAIFEENLARYGDENLDTIHFRDARLWNFCCPHRA